MHQFAFSFLFDFLESNVLGFFLRGNFGSLFLSLHNLKNK